MLNSNPERVERFAGRALLALAGAVILLVAVYAVGASGIPGEALTTLIDWAVARQAPATGSPITQAVLAAWG